MKRFIAIVAVALLCATAFAGEVSVGGRLIGSYDLLGAIGSSNSSWNNKEKFGFGFAAYGNFGLYESEKIAIGIQPELMLIFNQGFSLSKDVSDIGLCEHDDKYSSLELPLLATFSFKINEKVSIGAGAGLFGAVSLGHEYTSKIDGVVDESNTDITWQAGLAADLNCGIKAGPGTVVIDLRFTKELFDSEGDFGLGDRWSNLTFGAGYQYTF